MTFITPESNVYFENYLLTTPKNRAESSDVTFEEVLPIYVKGDSKECLTLQVTGTRKCLCFVIFSESHLSACTSHNNGSF